MRKGQPVSAAAELYHYCCAGGISFVTWWYEYLLGMLLRRGPDQTAYFTPEICRVCGRPGVSLCLRGLPGQCKYDSDGYVKKASTYSTYLHITPYADSLFAGFVYSKACFLRINIIVFNFHDGDSSLPLSAASCRRRSCFSLGLASAVSFIAAALGRSGYVSCFWHTKSSN